jgi:alkanesulfonate monooxygenase SsuD/methylene tetrahydromethanopterin reductase-like flavin-dependent oxidoreductase (luciferase family)
VITLLVAVPRHGVGTVHGRRPAARDGHRFNLPVSAPEVVLAAIAGVTTRLRLASGVTVLSSQDPVRVFQQFATLDHVSNGRAEIFASRGAFTESFPLLATT